MSQRTTQALREHKIIPDILPEGTDLSYDLNVKFPNATLDVPGKELGREETQPEPKLYLDPVVRAEPILPSSAVLRLNSQA